MTNPPPDTRGRFVRDSARSRARTDALLQATHELLSEVGYEELTMDAVAARAHAGKATIYRRWPDKRDLVMAALSRRQTEHPPVLLTGSNLREDLLELLGVLREVVQGEDARMFSRLVSVALSDPTFGQFFRSDLLERRRRECEQIIRRAIARGELQPGASAAQLLDLVLSQLIFQVVFKGQELSHDFVTSVIDDVLLPVLSVHRATSEG